MYAYIWREKENESAHVSDWKSGVNLCFDELNLKSSLEKIRRITGSCLFRLLDSQDG